MADDLGEPRREGRFDLPIAKNGPYWKSPTAFLRLLDAWRRDGDLDGLDKAENREAGTDEQLDKLLEVL